jgi:hypothetical protein
MSSSYDTTILDHLAEYFLYLAAAPLFWFSLNSSYDHEFHLSRRLGMIPFDYECIMKFSYIFRQSDDTLSKYTIGTWSKKVKRSEVIKHGTALDISRLPAATKFNKSKKKKECDEMVEEKTRNPRHKLNKVGRQLQVTRETDDDLGDDIGEA